MGLTRAIALQRRIRPRMRQGPVSRMPRGGIEPPHAASKAAALSSELPGRSAQGTRAELCGSLGLLLVTDASDEYAYDRRVVLGAREAHQLVEGFLFRERLSIRAVRGHRDVGVADTDDPGCERDVLLGETVRIAASVPVLVARADDSGDAAQGGMGAEDPLADDRVLSDERPLALVERPRLVQELVRDGEHAEIVELRSTFEIFELVAA